VSWLTDNFTEADRKVTSSTRWPRLRRFMHHPITDLMVMMLILLSVMCIIAEVLSPPGRLQYWLRIADNVFIGIFVVELSLRYVIAPTKKRFFRSYWLDIISILPVTRAFRILRLLRLLRLFRFGVMLDRRMARAARIFRRGREGYVMVIFAIITFVLVGALAINLLEGAHNADFESFDEALWWAVMSLIAGEPVGGQATTDGGRVVELLLMIGGVTVFAMFTGTVTAAVLQVVNDRTEEINMEIEDLTGHVLVCGFKRGSEGMIAELQVDPVIKSNGIVVITDHDVEPQLHASNVSTDRVCFLRGDHTRVDVLERAGVERVAMAIILPDKYGSLSDQDRDARSVLTALVIEKLNKQAYVVVELLNPDNETYLRMAGVEEVLVSDRHTGRLLGSTSRNRGLMRTFRELLTSEYGNQFFKMRLPAAWNGQSVGTIHDRLKLAYNATLISVERTGSNAATMVNPPPKEVLIEGDRIVYVAKKPIKKVK